MNFVLKMTLTLTMRWQKRPTFLPFWTIINFHYLFQFFQHFIFLFLLRPPKWKCQKILLFSLVFHFKFTFHDKRKHAKNNVALLSLVGVHEGNKVLKLLVCFEAILLKISQKNNSSLNECRRKLKTAIKLKPYLSTITARLTRDITPEVISCFGEIKQT